MEDVTPQVEPLSLWRDELQQALEGGEFSPWTGLQLLDVDDFKATAERYLQFKHSLGINKHELPAKFFGELPSLKVGSSDAFGSDHAPTAEMGLAMLEWMMKTQQGSLRVSSGSFQGSCSFLNGLRRSRS